MADERIEDITGGELTTVAEDDLLVILDASDTTDDADGTAKNIKHKTLVPYPRGYIDGLTTSRASATSIAVAAGVARDDADSENMSLSSSLTKTEAAWTVGNNNGGLDSGTTFTNTTWYYVYLIKRDDTGVVDVLFSTSKTTPTLPTNYTHSRLIGAFYHDTGGSTDILDFIQSGDYFRWDPDNIQDLSTTSPATTWTSTTLSVPPISGVVAQGYAIVRKTSSSDRKIGMSSGLAASPTNIWNGEVYVLNQLAGNPDEIASQFAIQVDSSGQVKYLADSTSNIQVQIWTSGWIWGRGKE